MKQLLSKICSLDLGPCRTGNKDAFDILSRELPLVIKEYESGTKFNGWEVPPKWEPVRGVIKKLSGKIIYDGTEHPFGVVSLSPSFSGKVKVSELKEHLFYAEDPKQIIWHCQYYYRPFKKTWGFSVPKSFYDSLNEEEYLVEIETEETQGTLKAGEFLLEGESDKTFVITAHLCHPFQANDGLSGVIVGVEVFKELIKRKSRRFSYKFFTGAEHLSTIFYLDELPPSEIEKIEGCILLEMLGRPPLQIQQSFTGKSYIDRIATHILNTEFSGGDVYEFRKLVGNDETVWEAPGYEVPTITICGEFPYYGYHTIDDSPDIIDEDTLENSKKFILKIIEVIENNSVINRHFEGLLCLSAPEYQLYIEPGTDPSMKTLERNPLIQRKWNYLMDCIIRYFDGKTTILDIAEKHNLPFYQVLEYVKEFENKKLVSLELI